MHTQVQLGDLAVDVVRKDIKNVHLSVYPPTGRVRISAPLRMSLDTIRVFAISKLDWIRSQQRKVREQARETPREYLDRESHFVWGKRYLLQVTEVDRAPSVELKHRTIVLRVRPGTDTETKQALFAKWYREQLKIAVPALVAKWASLLGVTVDRVFIQHMKTKWGGCNPNTRAIRLNTELAKKPVVCLEFIIVHELVHMKHRRHDDRFKAMMDRYLPQWRSVREIINAEPLRHETWSY